MLCVYGQAQDSTQSRMEILARAQKDRILLRWAASDPMVWHFANKYGMKLERYTIMRDGKVLSRPEKKEFPKLFKPLPLQEWEALSDSNEYALVAAQAIYGESFEVTEEFSSELSRAINKTKEMEQRHFFSLFAADQSRTIAQASGLFYEDLDVEKNEKYLYAVSCQVPRETMEIDTGQVYIGVMDYFPLPRPEGLSLKAEDTTVMVSWEGKRFQNFYNSYSVERSDDGGQTYRAISDLPIVNPLKEDGSCPDYIVKVDTVGSYNKKYIYRIKGINPFGEVSEPSDTASVICIPGLPFSPHVMGYEIGMDGRMMVTWTFPKEGLSLIKGFYLKRAGRFDGEQKTIAEHLLPTDTMAIDPAPLASNYYTVVAYDQYGNERKSMPYLAMLEDSIAPLAPVSLSGKIDSAGVVTLQWKANQEVDLRGYRVYRSSFAEKEFEQVTTKEVSAPTFSDTIEIKTLTKYVYYKILAVDGHHNPSEFSKVLQLERPDIIPPVSPQFESIEVTEEGIRLSWIRSSSTDVSEHALYRKGAADKGWIKIFSTSGKDSLRAFVDQKTEINETYAYTLVAVDRSGLESPPAKPFTKKRIRIAQLPVIKNFTGQADRNQKAIGLSWKYDLPEVSRYLLYKAKADESIELYKEIPGSEQSFRDAELKTNTIYRYRLQARLKDGSLSPFSEEIVVNY